jgi:thioredoxin 1
MSNENIVMLSDTDFEKQVLNSEEPVLVDFYADWCGPCKMIAPFLEDLASEYKGKVKIAKLNVDANADSAMKYGVRSIPTLIMFKNGQQDSMIVGADPNKIKNLVSAAA